MHNGCSKSQRMANIPCTVDFAPAAVRAPKDPAMKYWNILFEVSPLLLLYPPKLGILLTSTFVNGLSKEAPASALPRCWMASEETLMAGNLWRVHVRSAVHVVEGRGAIWEICRVECNEIGLKEKKVKVGCRFCQGSTILFWQRPRLARK